MFSPRGHKKTTIIVTLIQLFVFNGTKGQDFFGNYEEVTSPPPESIGPLPKCGEDDQKGRFKCVPYYNCDPITNTIVNYPEVDGSNIINKKYPTTHQPRCGGLLEVCCQIPNGTVNSFEYVPTINFEFEPKCGIKDKRANETRLGEFPWMVALLEAATEETKIFCSGSLLSPVVVLTAAHCVQNLKLEQIRVRVGKWNVESKNEEVPYQDKSVSKIVIHEHYLDSTLYNDVALLVLNSSITKRDNVGTICLSRDVAILDSQNCSVTEWDNKSLQGKNSYTGVLKARQFSLISKKSCQKELRTKLGEEFVLHHSFICTNDGNGTCWGDGGGPLVCPDSAQRYFQIGIVSWSVDCGLPYVYTKVIGFVDWVDLKLRELGYNSISYTL